MLEDVVPPFAIAFPRLMPRVADGCRAAGCTRERRLV